LTKVTTPFLQKKPKTMPQITGSGTPESVTRPPKEVYMRWFFVLSLLAVACAQAVSSQVIVGNVRITALTPRLMRVEPKGPNGFEDRTTFMAANRGFAGVPILSVQDTSNGTLVTTSFYTILVSQHAPPAACAAAMPNTDVSGANRTPSYPNGTVVPDDGGASCCATCQQDDDCRAWYNSNLVCLCVCVCVCIDCCVCVG
jgi:hypothetical protein